MLRFIFSIFILFLVILVLPVSVSAATLGQRLSGRILLQVQAHGEGWYVDPVTKHRYFLGRAEDAYALMRKKGLGIRHQELLKYLSTRFPSRLAGRIVLDVESHGEAYYVLPGTLKGMYLKGPKEALAVMRQYGLGISNKDLTLIPVALDSATATFAQPLALYPPPAPSASEVETLEQQVLHLVNQHRKSLNLSPLQWNDAVANVAREHSIQMAKGSVPFGHAGFSDRVNILHGQLSFTNVAENVHKNANVLDPAASVLGSWLQSPEHSANMGNSVYDLTGIGVAKVGTAYYFTQIFLNSSSN